MVDKFTAKPGDVVFYQHPLMKGFKGFLKMVHSDDVFVYDYQKGDSVTVRQLVPLDPSATPASPKNKHTVSSKHLTKIADKEFRKW